ncbi:unnamed protein product [Phytophthora lilii]|uniref:Unnamed protein product n=1 Tax=Phytophthora lilii TaxID=2077276 RepID=A0A9W6TB10_9STRA|nr:unnamed protein product [Phytophthora lilii]
MQQFKALNPGSIATMEQDGEGRFKRAMIAVKAITDSMLGYERILGIDCAYSKCPRYDGQQMTLAGVDGNRETVIIAFALVPSEDSHYYGWCFRQLLREGYILDRHLTFAPE